MIHFTKGQTQDVYLTLKEKQTLTSPNYLFRFKNRTTNEEVKFVRLNNTDLSAHKDRYNQFSIVVNTFFTNKDSGEWEYFIYEQTSTTNTDPALATGLLESGIMDLNEATQFSFTEYQTNNTFIVR
jgi:ethanolamine utilization protein EutQ (cupin superfamily)